MKVYKKNKIKYNYIYQKFVINRDYLQFAKKNKLNFQYLVGFRNQLGILNINLFEVLLKKIVKIIYFFSIKKKHVLFLGVSDVSSKIFSHLSKQKNYSFISSNCWVYGSLSNKEHVMNTMDHQKRLTKMLKWDVSSKPDLIVILTKNPKKDLIKEVTLLNVPVICLANDVSNTYSTDFKVLSGENIERYLFLILCSLIKKKYI